MAPLRLALATILISLLCSSASGAADLQTELRFAKGLSELGYFGLATERYRALDWRKQSDPKARRAVLDGLVENFESAGRYVPARQRQLAFLRQARQELADYLAKAKLDTRSRREFRMRYGQDLLAIGRVSGELLERKPRGTDLAAVGREGLAAFDAAGALFSKVLKEDHETLKRLKAKPDVSDADRRLYRTCLTGLVVAETQLGWAQYGRAQLQKTRGDAKAYAAGLDQARKTFERQAKAHPTLIAGCSAALGEGLCLLELKKPKEAVKALDVALGVKHSRATQAIRYQAFDGKARCLAALGQYPEAVETLKTMAREFRHLPPALRLARQMVYAQLVGESADSLLAQAVKTRNEAKALAAKKDPASRRKRDDLLGKAEHLTDAAKARYADAVRAIRSLADDENPYTEEASLLLGRWMASGGVRRRMRATEFYSQGERLFEAGAFAKSIDAYREAICAAGGSRKDARVAMDAWIRMGMAYYRLKDNYAAGLVLGRVARLYPDSPFAEKAATYSSMFLGAKYAEDKTPFSARAYLQAQELLVNRYPRAPAAKKAALRLGDVRRDQRRYAEAARFYGKVSRASAFYERASYLAAWCLWQATQERQKDAPAEARRLAAETEKRANAFIRWSESQPAGVGKAAAERAVYLAKARILLAGAYLIQKRYDAVLKVLSKPALAKIRQLPADQSTLVADAVLRRIRALCAKENEEDLYKAGEETAALRKEPRVPARLKSAAARLVGATFLKLSEQHAKAKGYKEGRKDLTMKRYLLRGRRYLVLSIDLSPEKSVSEYSEVASALYEAGAYQDAAEVFRQVVRRFRKSARHADAVRDAQLWVGRAYMKAGDYEKAAEEFRALVTRYSRWLEPRRRLALCYESEAIRRYGDAEVQWRIIEETLRKGSKEWFEARYHRVDDLLKEKREPLAFQLLAAALVTYPELGGKASSKRFEDLLKLFSDAQRKRLTELRREAR